MLPTKVWLTSTKWVDSRTLIGFSWVTLNQHILRLFFFIEVSSVLEFWMQKLLRSLRYLNLKFSGLLIAIIALLTIVINQVDIIFLFFYPCDLISECLIHFLDCWNIQDSSILRLSCCITLSPLSILIW
jgi:hypothetical protein